ncbi:MAG TPA: hypothetical protein VNL95_09075 [Dehalococcoidia bacterium]|nr:hypothetical protein [Dehalococcoidia bacterium]
MDRGHHLLDPTEGDVLHARSDLERGFHGSAAFSAEQESGRVLRAVFQRLGGKARGRPGVDLVQEPASGRGAQE